MSYKPCDFCNRSDKKTSTRFYKSEVLGILIKVTICDECMEKDKKHIWGKSIEGSE